MQDSGNSNKQLRYLSQPAFLEEAVYPPLMVRTIVLVVVVLTLFVVWAAVSEVSEVAIAPGEVVPGQFMQVIQHLEGGIVSEILVKEGDIVEEGQDLARLDGLSFKKDLQRLRLRQMTLELQAERLNAFVRDVMPDFDSVVDGHDNVKQEQMDMFLSMVSARDSAVDVVEKQLNQKREVIKSLQGKRKLVSENIDLIQQEYDMKEKLLEKEMVSKVAFLKVSKQLNDQKGQLEEILSTSLQAKGAIAEYDKRLASLHAKYKEEAYLKLEGIQLQIAQNSETIEKLVDRVKRLDVKSPVNGLVKTLQVTTVGGVIVPGQPIMDVMPIDENIIVECKIKPSDIGHIKVGQDAEVKISSFDFSRYGGVKGKLSYISASTIEGKDGKKHYVGRITLDKGYVGDIPGKNVLVPGMTVQAGIITGEKTVLAYLLKPIKASLDSALNER